MRSLAFIMILIFALLHLLGFFKAYHLVRIYEISAAVSRAWGIVWLLCSMLLVLTAVFYHNRNKHWLMVGIVAVMFSQILVFSFWKDAMYGSVINALLIELIYIEASGKTFWNRKQQEA